MKTINLLCVLALALCGCATTPAPATDDYSSLYDGRPKTVFATEMPTADAAQAIRRGDQALARGDADRALWLYIQSLRHDSRTPVGFARIGTVHERRGNLALAARAYEGALEREPDNVALRERLATVLLNAREPDRAREHLELIASSPQAGWRTYNGLGILADLDGDHAGAINHFERALALTPDSTRLLSNLGYSRYLHGDWDSARAAYVRALAIEPRHELALRNLALLEVRAGNAGTATELLTRIMPEAEALNDVGYFAMLAGEHGLAAAYLRRAIDASPSYYALAHRNLARNAEAASAASASALPAADSGRPRAAGAALPPPQTIAASATPRSEPARRPTAARDGVAHSAPAAIAAPVSQPPRPTTGHAAATHAAPAIGQLADYERRWVRASVLNVRDAASQSSETIDKLRRGHVVRILAIDGVWSRVLYWDHGNDAVATREGWVHSSYLTAQRVRT